LFKTLRTFVMPSHLRSKLPRKVVHPRTAPSSKRD